MKPIRLLLACILLVTMTLSISACVSSSSHSESADGTHISQRAYSFASKTGLQGATASQEAQGPNGIILKRDVRVEGIETESQAPDVAAVAGNLMGNMFSYMLTNPAIQERYASPPSIVYQVAPTATNLPPVVPVATGALPPLNGPLPPATPELNPLAADGQPASLGDDAPPPAPSESLPPDVSDSEA